MITGFDMFKPPSGDWVVIVRSHDDNHLYSRGPRIWYKSDPGDPEERLIRMLEYAL